MSVPYSERCECKTSRYQVGARGSRIYSRCRARAVYMVALVNPTLANQGRVDSVRACGTHAAIYRSQGLLKSERRLHV